ncbi:MAG: SDR family NAD(P)-dependent oxidoreductase [Terrimesophilobacter sp.]
MHAASAPGESPRDLSGRVALVSGAGSRSGIGFATARALAEMGARLVLTSTTNRIHERAAELRSSGFDALGFVARLDSEAAVDALHAGIVTAGIVPTILVNNAGMVSVSDGEMMTGGLDSNVADWRRSLDMSLTSAFLLTRAVVPGMRKAAWGRIVNVASVSGAVMATRNDVAYAAAKAGMVGLTRAVAVDEAAAGITSNAVAPGWIATGSQTDAEVVQGRRVPLGRSGTAEEVASAIAWLASPGASYITGQLIVVDGGNSVAEERG